MNLFKMKKLADAKKTDEEAEQLLHTKQGSCAESS